MNPLVELLLFIITAGGLFAGVVCVVTWHERIVLVLLCLFNVKVFPEARAVALLLYQHPEQWTSDDFRMSHATVGSIWIANEAYGLKVETPFGSWKPCALERRIIRDAVDWRLKEYVRAHLSHTLNGGLIR